MTMSAGERPRHGQVVPLPAQVRSRAEMKKGAGCIFGSQIAIHPI